MMQWLRIANIVLAVWGILRELVGHIRAVLPTKRKRLMMSEKMGVENIKQILDAVLDGVDLGKGVMADGRIDLGDLDDLFKALPGIVASTKLAVEDAAQVVPEAKDLSPEELAALGAHVVARLAVSNEKAVKIVEASLKLVADILGLVKAIKA